MPSAGKVLPLPAVLHRHRPALAELVGPLPLGVERKVPLGSGSKPPF